MANKPNPKVTNKKTETKGKPIAKTKSTPKHAKVAIKSPQKTIDKTSKLNALKSKAKANTMVNKKVSPSKAAAVTKTISKPTPKSDQRAIKPKPAAPISVAKPETKIEHKTILNINTANKKLVNKMTTNKTVTPPPTNGKTRYADTELAEFKKIIDDKLLVARQELNYLQEQIVEMNENNADIQGSDWFDDSSIHAEVELLNNMAIRQRQFIQNLDNALVRIENKTYGICMITGSLIDKKRLLLVPHATKSIEAKHIEQATMVPELNQVAPDERVLRRSAEGKGPKKPTAKKVKSKTSKEYDDDEGDDMIEAPIEELDGAFEGGED